MKILASILAVPLLLAGSAASAQTATDAQCLILANAFAKQAKEPQQQKAAEAAVYFYMGRLRDGLTTAQLKGLLDTSSKTITNENAGPKMDECLKAIQTRVELLATLAPAPASNPAQTTIPPRPQQPPANPQGR
jgi:hypothetical protein